MLGAFLLQSYPIISEQPNRPKADILAGNDRISFGVFAPIALMPAAFENLEQLTGE